MRSDSQRMGEEVAISLRDVSKCFKRYDRPVNRLKEALLPGKSYSENFWALKDICLEIPKGQTVGIVGRNGSGKSTLLQIIAGTLTSTTGKVQVTGRVSALLELGSGFNPEFTGRQNVFFNGRLLGLSQREIEGKFDEIAGFADIGDFLNQPVKTYSSGMLVRLAFAVAVNVSPEILIVDEALAVGDMFFQHRCMRQMRTLMDDGVTTLFVSHDANAIKTLCSWAVMIDNGKIIRVDSPDIIIKEYSKLSTELELKLLETDLNFSRKIIRESSDPSQNKGSYLSLLIEENPENLFRRGSGKARIEDIKILDNFGKDITKSPVFEFNQEITLLIRVKVHEYLENCITGFFVCDKNGNEIIGTNTYEENIEINGLQLNDELETRFKFRLSLRPNSYNITVAVAENYEASTLDWIDNAVIFQVLAPDTNKRITALVAVNMEVEVVKLSKIN